MVAANGDGVGMHQAAAIEHADGGCAAAEINRRDAHLRLILDQHRKPRCVRRRGHRFDAKMAALDGQHDIARDRGIAGHDMHVDAEFIAHHAVRITNAAR